MERTPVGMAMAVLIALGALQAFAPRDTPPLAATRLAVEHMHFNSLALSKAGIIAGGELGTLLFSTNQGKDWQRASMNVERQALINQISFAADGMLGMAVGHEGTILRTRDAGLSWQELAFDEENGEPLMSVAQLPSKEWIAVGAFGRALRSDPQGEQWAPLVLPAAVEDKHMNRIVGSADGQHWLIVGERGLVLRSGNAGQSWTLIAPFYDGSLFNAMTLPDGGWLAYGMRGHIFRSEGGDAPWLDSDMPVPVSFFGHGLSADGRIILVGQGSVLATSTDGGRHFSLSRAKGRATLTDLLLLPDGQGLVASDAGLQTFSPTPQAGPTPSPGAAQ